MWRLHCLVLFLAVALLACSWFSLKSGNAFGFIAGACFGLVGSTLTMFFVALVWEKGSAFLGLVRRIDHYQLRHRALAWAALKERLVAGKPVRGRVVLVKYYGCFLDIGVGFPALITAAEGASPNGLLPDLHAEVEALLLGFDDLDRHVLLTLRDRTWIAVDGIAVGHLPETPPLEDGTTFYSPVTNRAHEAFREQLERDGAVSCQLLTPRGEPQPVRLEKSERGLRVRALPASP
jgi:hypothetical protein